MSRQDDGMVLANRAHAVGTAAHEQPTKVMTTAEAGNHMLIQRPARMVVEMQNHGETKHPEEEPVGTFRAGGFHHGVLDATERRAAVMASYGAANGPAHKQGWMRDADQSPIGGVTTRDSQSLVLPYYSQSEARSAMNPVPAVTTRDRIALVVPEIIPATADVEVIDRVWTDEDIAECRFRMFDLREIAAAMAMVHHKDGSPYIVEGNKRERMKLYGNAVTPPVMALLVERLLATTLQNCLDEDPSITDLFCGAGGSSLGAEIAGGILRLGLNHWQKAIDTHAANFQHADHDCADISALTTHQIRRYPWSDILLASPECTNHSLAKGALRKKSVAASLFDDGPAGDDVQERSRATMWDVVRFVEMKQLQGHPYKAVVVENVPDAFKWGYNDDGQLFAMWRQAVEAAGNFRSEIVWLNSMFAPPTPQSRNRMYVVFWEKSLPAPDLRVCPVSWCPNCEKVVNGVQTWKRPNDPHPKGASYGSQYVYGCPDCHKTVFPGAFTAASAIDWSIPAQKIGERSQALAEATIERIRRGLTRLDTEPFAIRLSGKGYGGNPKPLTLPLITLTARQDLGMAWYDGQPGPHDSAVLPVCGPTYESTPGNRTKDPATTPLQTQHATLDKAIVVPAGGARQDNPSMGREPMHTLTTTESKAVLVVPMKDGEARAAVERSMPALTTRGEPALALPPNTNGRGRDAHTEPATTQTTETRMMLVTPGTQNAVPRRADTSPTQAMTTENPMSAIDVTDAKPTGKPTGKAKSKTQERRPRAKKASTRKKATGQSETPIAAAFAAAEKEDLRAHLENIGAPTGHLGPKPKGKAA